MFVVECNLSPFLLCFSAIVLALDLRALVGHVYNKYGFLDGLVNQFPWSWCISGKEHFSFEPDTFPAPREPVED